MSVLLSFTEGQDYNSNRDCAVYPSCENAIYASRYLCSLSSLCKMAFSHEGYTDCACAELAKLSL